MITPLTPDEVPEILGTEFVAEFHEAIEGAGRDFEEFRTSHPTWVPTLSKRFIAGLMHERIWGRILPYAEETSRIDIVDQEPTRTLTFGGRIVIRIKKHDDHDRISSYPTRGMLGFYGQHSTPSLEGLAKFGLALGYRWNDDLYAVDAVVLSFQDMDSKNPIWSVELVKKVQGTNTTITHRSLEMPDAPQLEIANELLAAFGKSFEAAGEA